MSVLIVNTFSPPLCFLIWKVAWSSGTYAASLAGHLRALQCLVCSVASSQPHEVKRENVLLPEAQIPEGSRWFFPKPSMHFGCLVLAWDPGLGFQNLLAPTPALMPGYLSLKSAFPTTSWLPESEHRRVWVCNNYSVSNPWVIPGGFTWLTKDSLCSTKPLDISSTNIFDHCFH